MDSLILAEKIESLRRCIQRIEDKKPDTINLLVQSLDLQDILVIKEALNKCHFEPEREIY